ncbi:acyltransferase [Photobacterium damselae]|uniref:acyltransferase n=1 Tax=Photobacterium damselae TaxID=38293 RepID=UPI003D7E9AC4
MIYKIKKKIFSYILSPEKYAKYIGVNLGERCRLNNKISFGSEPYLITIGDDFYCSSNISFITHDGSVNVFRNIYPEYKNAGIFSPISLGKNVFLGYGVTVLAGSIIGNNTIVGANSTVKGILESNSVYAGTPARYICSIDEYLNKTKNDFIYVSGEKEKYLREYFNL